MTGEDTPNSARQAGDGEVHASNGFYQLVDYDGPPDILPDAGVANGLIAVGSTGANVLTGTIVGPVALRVEIHDAAPPVNVTGWNKVVEVEQHTPSGRVSILSPFVDDQPNLPRLETMP